MHVLKWKRKERKRWGFSKDGVKLNLKMLFHFCRLSLLQTLFTVKNWRKMKMVKYLGMCITRLEKKLCKPLKVNQQTLFTPFCSNFYKHTDTNPLAAKPWKTFSSKGFLKILKYQIVSTGCYIWKRWIMKTQRK